MKNPADWGEPINITLKGNEEYIDSNLAEVTTYYYVLQAFDEVPNNSTYSEAISGTTILGQHPPVINNSVVDFTMDEDTKDESHIDLNHWFMDVNNDILKFSYDENENITITILENKSVRLEPMANWSGEEILTFYANDSFEEISDFVTITVDAINDPPGVVTIITPKDGTEIESGEKLNFTGVCYDIDLPYGDELTFNWSSDIDGKIGVGRNLNDIELTVGKHNITLEVSDIAGKKSSITIKIIVKDKIDNLKDDKNQQMNMNVIIIGIFVVILIIILLLLLLIYFKKEKITDLKTKKK